MTIKLKGSTDGSVSFQAPADTSPTGSDITLTLPTTAGSADQFVKNSGTAGTLEYSSMVETSTGVGIGTSSPTNFGSNYKTLELEGNSGGVFRSTGGSHSADFYQDTSGIAFLRTATAADLAFSTNNTERMRIDSSGNVGIGRTPSNKLDVADGDSRLIFRDNGANSELILMSEVSGGSALYFGDANDGVRGGFFYNSSDDHMSIRGYNNAERLRIVSGGSIRYNQTTTNSPGFNNTTTGLGVENSSGAAVHISRSNNSPLTVNRNSNGTVVDLRRSGSQKGNIQVTNTTATFNSASDYRLKENVVALSDGITRLKQLSPSRFNFIEEPSITVDGFIAHEVQAVVPEAVTGTHNEVDDDGNPVMQGMDYGKVTPLLTAALQEAIAKIETLEAKVAALEAGS